MGSTTGTWTRGRSVGRWRRTSILAGRGETASTSTLATTDDGPWLWVLVRGGADSAWVLLVSYGGFWKNFLFFVAASSRGSHLEIWMLPSTLYLSVFVLVNGCCLWSTAYGFFGTRALLGSTVDTRLREVLDTFQHFLRCGELQFSQRVSHVETWTLFQQVLHSWQFAAVVQLSPR